MKNTVTHKEVFNWWDGKVIIDELKEFSDDRGMVTELWRVDDNKSYTDPTRTSVMSYWSLTKPFVRRGPHQHENQCDFFISFKNNMVYEFTNVDTNEQKFFITDPSKIYRVKVDTPIVHA